jgi:hypothetical protein
MAADAADWVMFSAWAAAVICWRWATATKMRSWSRVIGKPIVLGD